MGVMSDPLGWLLLRHIHLLTLTIDHGNVLGKRLGELSTLLFAMGYHQLDVGEHLPFFLIEGRKRLMVLAYSCDKDLATFLGCPPLIAYRFCRIQLPLDLTPAEVCANPLMREAAIGKLNTKGWNTIEPIKGVTWSRVALLLGHVRELVLEISLDREDVDVRQRADNISTLSQQVRNDLPSYLHWDGSTESTLRLRSTIPVYIHLDLLYNSFLLQRILVKRSLTESETLVSLAHQIIQAMLALIAVGHRCGNSFSELGWTVFSPIFLRPLIPYFGLPSAGILAIEVLRQTQNARPWPGERLFTRSDVIQSLGTLASHIQYITLPQKGNYEICQQGRKVILQILDYVLAAPVDADWLDEDLLNDGTHFLRWIDGFSWNE
ncbi:chromatin structure remodeling complex protein RSC3 [Penicillium nucicola]|uniref:chromatin structure remodeling complex protein RSC3 n=1 Tax=Penicillium nucicola TaxID=1850975 RepID=UPI0025451F40|nr:chromatin structure remodeling complex protein RSC3 [Penicillium nucicola]KAJ5758357.1 chromatin structure remodeling complex protein RSC3 [Penicillium nucicola]